MLAPIKLNLGIKIKLSKKFTKTLKTEILVINNCLLVASNNLTKPAPAKVNTIVQMSICKTIMEGPYPLPNNSIKESLPFGLTGISGMIYTYIDSVMLSIIQGN